MSRTFAVAAAFILSAQASPPSTPVLTAGQTDFCNMVYRCGLPMPAGHCPDSSALKKPDYKFDSIRCLEGRLLNKRGVTPADPQVGYRLYRFLGMEHRVIYQVEDDIPLSEGRLAYLLSDLPLAARLVSHFRKEAYNAEYVDAERKQFKGAKGKRLKGEARLISGSMQEKRLFYFGTGIATVAWWTLRGPALLDFTYARRGDKLHYQMKVLVFPGNAFINGIMNLGIFRKIVLSKIREVLIDITESSRQLAETGGNDLLVDAKWTPEEKRKIGELLEIP